MVLPRAVTGVDPIRVRSSICGSRSCTVRPMAGTRARAMVATADTVVVARLRAMAVHAADTEVVDTEVAMAAGMEPLQAVVDAPMVAEVVAIRAAVAVATPAEVVATLVAAIAKAMRDAHCNVSTGGNELL